MRLGELKLGKLRIANAVAGAFALVFAVVVCIQGVQAFQHQSGAAASGAKIESGTVKITEQGLAFVKGARTVAIGSTVVWTNLDGATHTVTATDKSFDSGNQKTNAKFTHKFPSIGTFSYFCKIHSFMKGSITVLAPYGK